MVVDLPNTTSEGSASEARRSCEPARRIGPPGQDRGGNAHRRTAVKHGPGNAATEQGPDLAAAILAEREAHETLRAARAHLASLVIEAVAAGGHYDDLARLSIRTTTGRCATLAERRREVDRLRQIVRRHRMTARHDIGTRKLDSAPSTQTSSEHKETITMEKLIKRRTIEETFSTDGVDEHRAADELDDRDDLEGEDDADEVDNEPPRTARPRR